MDWLAVWYLIDAVLIPGAAFSTLVIVALRVHASHHHTRGYVEACEQMEARFAYWRSLHERAPDQPIHLVEGDWKLQ